jgi:hypothetical protein
MDPGFSPGKDKWIGCRISPSLAAKPARDGAKKAARCTHHGIPGDIPLDENTIVDPGCLLDTSSVGIVQGKP